ncbi:MAG: head decoration protein [Pseudomonas sp.]|uniref:head decoration protein n=1 Tax=Pseudomonas sp. TaxID=306 RepID=UPI000CC140FB|nr:head decoration protein [Pseudomonas sp.]PJI50797.1 MAG: head decoration protein [Pseudomonas sp.]
MNKTEGFHAGEFLLSEGAGAISREQVTLAATTVNLPAGQLLGIVTASGEYAPYDNAATNGTEIVAGILYAPKPISTEPQAATIVARLAEVVDVALSGLDAAARADLKARNIIVRVGTPY